LRSVIRFRFSFGGVIGHRDCKTERDEQVTFFGLFLLFTRNSENYKFHRYDMEQQRSPRFVLSVGGSFNPIHMSHVRLLCEAKNALLSLFGPECVHKGALAVAHQNHVVAKLGAQDAIKAGHRLNMSNAVAREHVSFFCLSLFFEHFCAIG
jgi:hypothetical protein